MDLTSDEDNDNSVNRAGFCTPKKMKLIRNEANCNSKQPKHRSVKFGPELQSKYSFRKPDHTDPFKCICKLCNTSFRAEKSDTEGHEALGARTNFHRKKSQRCRYRGYGPSSI
ncbi:uncharacterized protein LOC117173067 [Belonocnema kinseyi]|uniref:uncharacterized protein LOC117173067 n=1 Tax=Belonocnema kinseyi TaxID=2817044 RepID=UPI00143D4225|nr:uncharacterized protein LOC117173067 [Belonocnema kinseyi]